MTDMLTRENVEKVFAGELRFKDLKFEKNSFYAPDDVEADKDGMVTYWVALNLIGNPVATGNTKKECVKSAREYVRNQKAGFIGGQDEEPDADMDVEAKETVEITAEEIHEEDMADEEQQEEAAEIPESKEDEQVEESETEVDTWLLGYIPKKRQEAILMLKKDDEGYWCRIGNGYIIQTCKGKQEEIIHEEKWKEFLKAFKNVVKAA